MTSGGKSYYYLADAIVSVIGLVDVDGNKVDTYTYSPRGVRLLAQSNEPVAQPYRFAGNYQDPTGLYPPPKPLLRRQHRPLHPARSLRPGEEPLSLCRRRPRQPHRPPAACTRLTIFKSDVGFVSSTATIGGVIGGEVSSVVPVVGTGAGTVVGGVAGVSFWVGFLVGEAVGS
ncbi:hypothetical protein GCM10023336_43170 [Streptomyces similanensis]|uniref:RHS repeat-associated core domain-containing protein n=1 Tax=Streptomyces similanensis TaxID=1274988 RepID=A0ABP9KTZ0_9ACTN